MNEKTRARAAKATADQSDNVASRRSARRGKMRGNSSFFRRDGGIFSGSSNSPLPQGELHPMSSGLRKQRDHEVPARQGNGMEIRLTGAARTKVAKALRDKIALDKSNADKLSQFDQRRRFLRAARRGKPTAAVVLERVNLARTKLWENPLGHPMLPSWIMAGPDKCGSTQIYEDLVMGRKFTYFPPPPMPPSLFSVLILVRNHLFLTRPTYHRQDQLQGILAHRRMCYTIGIV